MKRAFQLTLLVVFSMQITGCSLLKTLLGNSKKNERARLEKEIDKLEKEENVAELTRYCNMNRRKLSYKIRGKACRAKKRIGQKKFFENKGCTGIVDHYKASFGSYYPSYSRDPKVREANMKKYFEAGYRMAKCKKWDYIFTKLINKGFRKKKPTGTKLLESLEKRGIPVESTVVSWMDKQSDPFQGRYGYQAFENIGEYIKAKRKLKSYCGKILSYAKKTTTRSSQGTLIYYLYQGHCKVAVPFVIKQLSSESANRRRQACEVLGRLGGSRVIRKLRIIANTDPATRLERKYYRVYYVRKACRAAIGKIRLRTSG